MKKVTLIVGIIATLLILTGVIFKWMHWPGSGVALVLGCGIFALIYAPLLFINKQKLAKSGFQKFLNALVLVSMMLISISFLFKVMHWPGAGAGIYLGHILLVLLILFMFVLAVKEKEEPARLNRFNEAIFVVLLTAFSIFVWRMTTSMETIDYIVRLEQEINNTDSVVVKNSGMAFQAVENAGTKNPGYCASQLEKAQKVRQMSDEMVSFIGDLKERILYLTGEFKVGVPLDTLHLKYLMAKTRRDIATLILFMGEDQDPSKGEARILKLKLESYRDTLLTLIPEKEKENIMIGLSTDSVKEEYGYVQWEYYTLRTNTLIGALTSLSKLQLDVRMAESAAITSLMSDVMRAQLYEIYRLKNPKDKDTLK